MPHLYVGSLKARPGRRDDVVAILLEAADGLREHACSAYLVAVDEGDADTVWVSEVWDSKEAHDASLQLPETREAIARAMPMLTGEFGGGQGPLVGGLGAPGGA